MGTVNSRAFIEFDQEQYLLNKFLWSSEVAHEIVRQKFLIPELLKRTEPLRLLFDPPLRCNAFIPPANGKHPSKYEEPPNVFCEHIERNLEANSKLVVVHFNRAFERFLRMRLKLKQLKDADQKTVEKLRKYFKIGGSENYLEWLGNLGISASFNVPFKHFLDVCIYKEVRHDIAHADDDASINFGDKPWSDETIVAKCKKNAGWNGRRIFPIPTTDEQLKAAIQRVWGGARKMHSISKSDVNREGEPLIFFYALFSLGAYRKLAASIERSLPATDDSA